MAVWSLGLVDRPRVTAECAALVTCGNAYPLRSAICNQAERDSSSLTVSEAGFPYWESPQGINALCQFRDNILIATTNPDTTSHPIVSTVCSLLGEAWNPDVLCECM